MFESLRSFHSGRRGILAPLPEESLTSASEVGNNQARNLGSTDTQKPGHPWPGFFIVRLVGVLVAREETSLASDGTVSIQHWSKAGNRKNPYNVVQIS